MEKKLENLFRKIICPIENMQMFVGLNGHINGKYKILMQMFHIEYSSWCEQDFIIAQQFQYYFD